MEMEKIRALAALLDEFGLEEVKVQGDEVTLRRPRPETLVLSAPAQGGAPAQTAETGVTVHESAAPCEDLGTVRVTSPMVGMFYAAPSPNEPPFAAVGQEVKAGDILCIIEAMKLMNEITAEQDGVITKCYHGNGQLVEFGQPLFQMRCE